MSIYSYTEYDTVMNFHKSLSIIMPFIFNGFININDVLWILKC